jgi:hypothetical protein
VEEVFGCYLSACLIDQCYLARRKGNESFAGVGFVHRNIDQEHGVWRLFCMIYRIYS